MAHPQHEAIRKRYDFRCGYCGISETDTGGELTVDHFIPRSQGGDESEDNLIYCCYRCNQYKGVLMPDNPANPTILSEARLSLLHPLKENTGEHWRENEATGELEPLTERGKFHILSLRLNRTQLLAYRKRRAWRLLVERQTEVTKRELAVLRAHNERLQGLLSNSGENRRDDHES